MERNKAWDHTEAVHVDFEVHLVTLREKNAESEEGMVCCRQINGQRTQE
jgi:hypothetical protein